MVAGLLREEPRPAAHRTALLILRSEIQPPDPRERNRSRAHGAGLQRHIKIGLAEPLIAERCRPFADDQHFGMRGRVAQLAGAVAGAGDDLALARQNRADRHLAAPRRKPCFFQAPCP